ncbi:hypothetical protein KVF89_28410 [Nocardioides carbamazepini]|uniref:DUF6907 domain-containing protein n=1 Tax=Nocardioides carbamazepini TaxID=2854259 RepID=UPI002149F421|nr:hypothetical protein [Nocardioides carbamazepini]MCR1786491.1 hypothetical protein [Nocardioides carbamazepini]
MDDQRPTWLQESCPAWCTREHEEDDHPADRYHASEATFLPAIAATADTVPAASSADAVELIIHIRRQLDDPTDWVTVEPAQTRLPRLTLTRESAARLVRALAEQLDRDA